MSDAARPAMLTAVQCCLALAALFIAAPGSSNAAELTGYHWQEVAPGIYLHGSSDPLAPPVDGNAVVIVNDEDVFVVDTHINPAAARALVAQIRSVTDLPVTHVINTHGHDDHTNGNHTLQQAFPAAKFVAHRATLAKLRDEWEAMEQSRRETYGNTDPAALRQAADATDDEYRATALRVYAGYVEALKPELAALELTYPDTLFDEALVYERGNRRIEVRWLGAGNTAGDTVVWLPDEGIAISGDLLVQPVPFAFDAPMLQWVDTLDRLAELEPAIIVPGHGPVLRDLEYLRRVQELLRATIAQVRAAADSGTHYELLKDAVALDEYRERFTGDDAVHAFAWRSFYLEPALKSTWVALGHELPEKN